MSAPFPSRLPSFLLKEPPERRGIARDRVRLMVIDRQTFQVEHSCFNQLGDFLRPGDLLVFTLPHHTAALKGCEAPVESVCRFVSRASPR